jgi:hypothetical protein
MRKDERKRELDVRRKLDEWWSVQLNKNPGRMVLAVILLFNVVFFLLAAVVISTLSLEGTERMGFIEAAFCTITMILDAGCIQFVVSDIGQSGVAITLTCLGVVLIGMITFTGSLIGYITNYISNFIEVSAAGNRRLRISNHTVILNWNTRASEIVNDLLYCEEPQKVVILVNGGKAEVQREISERLADTVRRENIAIREKYKDLPWLQRRIKLHRKRFTNNLTVLVREGDVFSSVQLHDLSLKKAKAVVILGADVSRSQCRFENLERQQARGRGNSQTVKTLMQVADITGAQDSLDNQKIIVEITDDWTWDLVDRIIRTKQVEGKCNIVPVRVNRILGQILSQFSLMPELNLAYRELFSNKGVAFYSTSQEREDDTEFARRFLATHRHAIPLTFMDTKEGVHCYYAAGSQKSIDRESEVRPVEFRAAVNRDYWMERKNVVILGHNSKCRDIMEGFCAFGNEWNRDGREIVNILVIDSKENLEKMDYFRDYPFVSATVAADIFDKALICSTIEAFVDANEEDTSILILSDDGAPTEDIDANALANLIYVQDIINRRKQDPDFDPESIDVIVEIIDPKHHDIVNSYNVNNVVISNRYISKMITQISEKEALFDFYSDILTYDEAGTTGYDSKEIYAKKVSRFFTELPEECTAEQLIRAVLEETACEHGPGVQPNPTMVLGYVKPGGRMVLFSGNQGKIRVKLEEHDKLILFSNH